MPDSTAHTSALEEQLRADIKASMRDHDQVRTDTLRLALNAFHLEEVARTDEKSQRHREPLTEQDRIALLEKQVKQREEAAQLFRGANRTELAEKEEREAALLKVYLPTQMGDDELHSVVAGLIAAHGREFKVIMPLAARETKGRADGRRVQQVVRELLG